MPTTKHQRLSELAQKRRAAVWAGYLNIGEFHSGIYDCFHVSPYTKSAGNVDSQLFILLQDWVSAEYLDGQVNRTLVELGRDSNLPTNKKLGRLLHVLGDVAAFMALA